MNNPLQTPGALNWEAAPVQLPEMPMLPPGEDQMSATISAILPTLHVPLATNVAALSEKENMFGGKLTAATTSYQNADDSGQQGIGQLTSMLGQVGQLGQMAGQGGGSGGGLGGLGGFTQLMQPVMQAFQGAAGGGQGSGGGATTTAADQPEDQRDREHKADRDDDAAAEPYASQGTAEGAGAAPVAPSEGQQRGDGEDIARRM